MWHLQTRGRVTRGVSRLQSQHREQREMVSAFWMSQGNVMRSRLKRKKKKNQKEFIQPDSGCHVDETCVKNYKARFSKCLKDLHPRRHQETRTWPGLQWLGCCLRRLYSVPREHRSAPGSAHTAGDKSLWDLGSDLIRQYLLITV